MLQANYLARLSLINWAIYKASRVKQTNLVESFNICSKKLNKQEKSTTIFVIVSAKEAANANKKSQEFVITPPTTSSMKLITKKPNGTSYLSDEILS